MAVDADRNRVSLPVTGMTCASCVRRVERALTRVPGVAEASVNLATERATVAFDGAVADRPALEAAIESAGYGVRREAARPDGPAEAGAGPEPTAALTRREEREREIADLRLKALVSLAIGAGMMLLMYLPVSLDMTVVAPALLVAATGVQVWAGGGIYRAAWRAARHGSTTMDTLVAAGTSIAYGYSAFVTLWPSLAAGWGLPLDLYYETAVVIVALVLVGRWLEARAKSRTGDAIEAMARLQPRTATVVRDGREAEVPVESLRAGDVVRVRPGQSVPADGEVLDGRSTLDESLLTGESLPVDRAEGDTVIGGTVNGTGTLTVRLSRVGSETALARIIALVEDAQGSKAPSQRLADTVSAYFVPAILGVAVLTFAGWMVLGPEPRLPAALQAAISVLIVACPCALGLATPTAIMVATGRAAELGILVRSGEALERGRRIDTVVLDKTGTVTTGSLTVAAVRPAGAMAEDELLALAAAVELPSEHPVAMALVAQARERGLVPPAVEAWESIPGQGVTATVGGREALVGSARLMRRIGIDTGGLDGLPAGSPVYVAVDRALAGAVVVADRVRPEARTTVARLRQLGLDVHLLTGDGREVAESVAREVGIDHVIAEVLPDEKAARVEELQRAGRRVAMVGDGVNDAPALARADLGIAIGTGADVALAAADITILGDDLDRVVTALALSRRTVSVIRQGLFWAFAYNLVLVPLATGALFPLVRVLLSPVLAAAAMALSSVSVVTNALRLRRFDRPRDARHVVRPPVVDRLREVSYLVTIALVAAAVGGAALGFAQRSATSTGAVSAAEAGISAHLAMPDQVQAGVPAHLVYRLEDRSGRPFTDLVADHERLMHLVVVSADLQRFQHVHPQRTDRPGEYAVDLTLPESGRYLLFDELRTGSGEDVVIRDALTVPGTAPAAAPLREDTAAREVHGIRFGLEGADDVLWGRPSKLTFTVTDPATGLPLYGLRPYLGADAHAAILSRDGSWFLHTHGAAPGSGGMTMAMGPLRSAPEMADSHSDDVGARIEIDPTFPGPGLYKVWGQFEAADRTVLTAAFVVEVH